MAFYPGFAKTLSGVDLERYNEKISLCGVDPYELVEAECSEDSELWPIITSVDRLDYLVYKTRFVSKESMKGLNTLEAYNLFTSGLLYQPRAKKVSADLTVLLGKVRHSQSMAVDPLKAWLLVKDDGEIVTSHCTCMAGKCEACSHVAAIVFLVEDAGKLRDDVEGTDVLNACLPPTKSKTVPPKRAGDIDFASPAGKIPKISKSTLNESEKRASPRYISECKPPSQEAFDAFIEAIAEASPRCVLLSTLPKYADRFIPQKYTNWDKS